MPATAFANLPARAAPVCAPGRAKHLLLDAECVYYRGCLGHPGCRRLGSLTLYAAHRAPLYLTVDGRDPEPTQLAVVPPYLPHSVRSADDWITCLLIEPEHLDLARLPLFSCSGPDASTQLPWAVVLRLAQALGGLDAPPSAMTRPTAVSP